MIPEICAGRLLQSNPYIKIIFYKKNFMKYKWFGLMLLFVGLCPVLHAQDSASWKIVMNKKAVMHTGVEDTITNILRIKKSELANNGVFRIEFTPSKNDANRPWVRKMAMLDTNAQAVVQLDSSNMLQLYNKDLLKVLWNRKKIIAYTWTAPSDPAMAAAIRIRRTHLCTIVLAD